MIRFSSVVLALAIGTGCYAGAGYSGGGYVSTQTTASVGYVSSDPLAYSTPPPSEVNVDVYYEPRDGFVFVNGRHNWVGNQWVWQDGYWEAERPDHVYIQGSWNNGRWYDGRWEPQRAGYVYTGGYWDRGHRGHRWVQGTWEPQRHDHVYVRGTWSNSGGVRAYNRGRWENRGRVNTGVRVNTGGGAIIRNHPRRR